jgi:hypothetical protein
MRGLFVLGGLIATLSLPLGVSADKRCTSLAVPDTETMQNPIVFECDGDGIIDEVRYSDNRGRSYFAEQMPSGSKTWGWEIRDLGSDYFSFVSKRILRNGYLAKNGDNVWVGKLQQAYQEGRD